MGETWGWSGDQGRTECGKSFSRSLLGSGQMPCYLTLAWQPSQSAGLFSQADCGHGHMSSTVGRSSCLTKP